MLKYRAPHIAFLVIFWLDQSNPTCVTLTSSHHNSHRTVICQLIKLQCLDASISLEGSSIPTSLFFERDHSLQRGFPLDHVKIMTPENLQVTRRACAHN